MHPNRLDAFWRDEHPKARDARLNLEARIFFRMGYHPSELWRITWMEDGEQREMIVPKSICPDDDDE